jgi:hypothetical protein
MTLVTGAITLALALFAAQGPRAASAKHRKAGRAPTATVTERRVPGPPRSAGGAPRRTETASTAADSASGAGSAASSDTAAGDASEGTSAGAAAPSAGVKTAKTKVYTFGAMDVEGKLKTPQLLYFLNRVKLELEMSAPDHRSFMKELERTADDPSL